MDHMTSACLVVNPIAVDSYIFRYFTYKEPILELVILF